jgi:hypothetical protein
MMVDDVECVTVGVTIGRGNRSTRRELAPVPLCPLQIPYDLNCYRTRDSEVGSRRLTRATARPENKVTVVGDPPH